jgi:GPN-loop GTPase
VSSITGNGVSEFFEVMGTKREEYEREYKPELERRIRERQEEGKTEGLDKLMEDMNVKNTTINSKLGTTCTAMVNSEPVHLDTISDGEDEDDGYLVDPDPMDDDDDDDEEGLQRKFQQAALNAQANNSIEDGEFDRWASEAARGARGM